MESDSTQVVRERVAAQILGVSHRTLQRWRLEGFGPPFVRIGRRAVGYRKADLTSYVDGRMVQSTSEEETR